MMRAITLYEPWASLWVMGEKIHETRSWPLNGLGWIAVHAGKSEDYLALVYKEPFLSAFKKERERRGAPFSAMDLPRGHVIGAVYVSAILPTNEARLRKTTTEQE